MLDATRRQVLRRALVCAFLGWALAACERSPSSAGSGSAPTKPVLVATTGMVADMVRAVAGDLADVRQMMPAGVDPHLYRPTRDDVAMLVAARAVFANGLHLEGRMDEAFERVAKGGILLVRVAEQGGKSTIGTGESESAHDPHVWMDPSLWASFVPSVEKAVASLFPDHAEVISDRARAYERELARLDEYTRGVIASVPEPARVLVTAHDAFRYFGARYGVQVEGVQGLSTESEAGLASVERLVAMLVDRKVPAVFVESTVTDRNVRALIEGAKARGHVVSLGGSLFSDAMGPAGTYEGTYVGMIDHNATTIARALGGQAPARGMNGRLAETNP